MKRLLILLFMACALNAVVKADTTPFSTNVSNMWLSGNKSGVLTIANQRLKDNPDDLAGLILTLQYQIAFFDVANVSASINKVLAAEDKITTPNFLKSYPDLKTSLLYLQQNLPSYSPKELQTEAAKGSISGKPMEFLSILQAAEADGLIH